MTSPLKKVLADCFETVNGLPEAVAYAENFHSGGLILLLMVVICV